MSDAPQSNPEWTVSALHVYPIKSCAGLDLKAVRFDELGPLYDRRFMLVDQTGAFLSQRQLPRMALIAPRLGPMALQVSAPGMPMLKVAMTAPESRRVEVELRDYRALAEDVGEHAANWFSTFLQRSCRLVRMPVDVLRFADTHYAGPGVQLGFVDGFPALLANEASLADLNARLSEPVAMHRFRPNIVVRGGAAFAEDSWREIRIGEVSFDVVKPCSRCKIVNVEPSTAETGTEPLAALATYRTQGHNVMFGQNCVHRALGSIRVGDRVQLCD